MQRSMVSGNGRRCLRCGASGGSATVSSVGLTRLSRRRGANVLNAVRLMVSGLVVLVGRTGVFDVYECENDVALGCIMLRPSDVGRVRQSP